MPISAEVLVELRRELAALEARTAALRAVIAAYEQGAAAEVPQPRPPRHRASPVLDFVEAHLRRVRRRQTARQIAEAMGAAGVAVPRINCGRSGIVAIAKVQPPQGPRLRAGGLEEMKKKGLWAC
jgi:hypothetical protein